MSPVSTFATLWNTKVAANTVASGGTMAQISPIDDCRYLIWNCLLVIARIKCRYDQKFRMGLFGLLVRTDWRPRATIDKRSLDSLLHPKLHVIQAVFGSPFPISIAL